MTTSNDSRSTPSHSPLHLRAAAAPLQTARDHLAKGKLEAAQRQCQSVLASRTNDVEAWNLLAEILHAQGQLSAAADALRQSLSLSPRQPESLNNLGAILTECNESVLALELLRSAVRLFPEFAPIRNSLGNAHRQLGQLQYAAEAYQAAIALDPAMAVAHNNWGAVMVQLELNDAQAEASLRMALRLDPQKATARLNLSALYNRQRKFAEAEREVRAAIQQLGETPETLSNLGLALQGLGQRGKAIHCLQRAAQAAPQLSHNYLFAIGHDEGASDAALFEAHRRWGRWMESLAEPLPSRERDVSNLRPIRIGYVSGDFRKHAVARYMLPLLEHHDRQKFEIYGYSESLAPDEVTSVVEQNCTDWRVTTGASDLAVAHQIVEDQIDILVDLAGHTKGNRLGVFAWRPAPVQVAWLGYPHTTGLESIDYVLTNWSLNPEGTEQYYTERLHRVDGPTVCWLPPNNAPRMTPLPAKTTGRLTFGSMHRPDKISSATVELWSQVLEAVPDSQLRVFHPSLRGVCRSHLLNAFRNRGLDNRVELRHEAGSGGYLAEYGHIDIALDVTSWTGGTTTRDACWMGAVPIALRGERRAARGSADVLHWLNLESHVAHDVEGYVALAAAVAQDLDQLAELRSGLRSRTREALCDFARTTRAIEGSFVAMLQESSNAQRISR